MSHSPLKIPHEEQLANNRENNVFERITEDFSKFQQFHAQGRTRKHKGTLISHQRTPDSHVELYLIDQ